MVQTQRSREIATGTALPRMSHSKIMAVVAWLKQPATISMVAEVTKTKAEGRPMVHPRHEGCKLDRGWCMKHHAAADC